jgi:glutamyl-Q tRNA(Asp) synthetase
MLEASSSPPGPACCGRFAPSPSGPLHFGSLVAALASHLDARRQGGRWLVRIEDLDTPRAQPGSAADILQTLERYGLSWDGEVVYQSGRTAHYEEALRRLAPGTYPCNCSRREIEDSLQQLGEPLLGASGERRYPGTCRSGLTLGRPATAVRIRVDGEMIGFEDAIQGWTEQNLDHEIGDFVVRRADGLFAYQLAVVVDDFAAGVTDVVRGADLLASTPRQIHLYRALGGIAPRYKHVPVATTAGGYKLSKQTLARPVAAENPPQTLFKALRFLGQEPPPELSAAGVGEIVQWGIANWSVARVPRTGGQAVDDRLEVAR